MNHRCTPADHELHGRAEVPRQRDHRREIGRYPRVADAQGAAGCRREALHIDRFRTCASAAKIVRLGRGTAHPPAHAGSFRVAISPTSSRLPRPEQSEADHAVTGRPLRSTGVQRCQAALASPASRPRRVVGDHHSALSPLACPSASANAVVGACALDVRVMKCYIPA